MFTSYYPMRGQYFRTWMWQFPHTQKTELQLFSHNLEIAEGVGSNAKISDKSTVKVFDWNS